MTVCSIQQYENKGDARYQGINCNINYLFNPLLWALCLILILGDPGTQGQSDGWGEIKNFLCAFSPDPTDSVPCLILDDPLY